MSHVAGVTIITDVLANEDAISATLNEFGTFARLDDEHYGGDRHPQYHVWGAGINYLRVRKFVKTLRERVKDWYDAEYLRDPTGLYVLAIIEDEHDDSPTPVWVLGSPSQSAYWTHDDPDADDER